MNKHNQIGYYLEHREYKSNIQTELFVNIMLYTSTISSSTSTKEIFLELKKFLARDKKIIHSSEKNETEGLTAIFKLKDGQYFVNLSLNSFDTIRRIAFTNYISKTNNIYKEVYDFIRIIFIKKGLLYSCKDDIEKGNKSNLLKESELMIFYLKFLYMNKRLNFTNLYSSRKLQTKVSKSSFNLMCIYHKEFYTDSALEENAQCADIFVGFLFFLKNYINSIEELSPRITYLTVFSDEISYSNNKDNNYLVDFLSFETKEFPLEKYDKQMFVDEPKRFTDEDLKTFDCSYKTFLLKKQLIDNIKITLNKILHYLIKSEKEGIYKLVDISSVTKISN